MMMQRLMGWVWWEAIWVMPSRIAKNHDSEKMICILATLPNYKW